MLTLFLSFLVSQASAFSDVPTTHVDAEGVQYVESQGIVSGYADGTFRPDTGINRAEFTKIVIGAISTEEERAVCASRKAILFSDTPSTEWYYPYVCVAKDRGVIRGYPDGSFRPANDIAFVEGAKILSNAFSLQANADSSIWYEPFVRALAARYAIPLEISTASQFLTRGQMAEMVFRLHAQNVSKPSRTFEELTGQTSPSSSSRVSSSKSSPGASSAAARTSLPYTFPMTASWADDWKLVHIESTDASLKNVEVQEETEGKFETFFRMHIPKGSGSRFTWAFYDKPLSGFHGWAPSPAEPQKNMYLRYFVRLPKNFEYNRGGTLPGMFTGLTNGRDDESTASLYVSWNKEGKLDLVGRFMEKSYGATQGILSTDILLPADDEWHEIILRGQLNTEPSRGNGIIEAWLDGEKIFSTSSILFSNRTNDAWDALIPGISYGGLDNSSLSPIDQYIDVAGYEFSDKPF